MASPVKKYRRKTSGLRGGFAMKGSLAPPDSADPYAALEQILKTIGRFWMSEEGKLEDIRLLAQDAIDRRGRTSGPSPGSALPSPRSHRRRAE